MRVFTHSSNETVGSTFAIVVMKILWNGCKNKLYFLSFWREIWHTIHTQINIHQYEFTHIHTCNRCVWACLYLEDDSEGLCALSVCVCVCESEYVGWGRVCVGGLRFLSFGVKSGNGDSGKEKLFVSCQFWLFLQ